MPARAGIPLLPSLLQNLRPGGLLQRDIAAQMEHLIQDEGKSAHLTDAKSQVLMPSAQKTSCLQPLQLSRPIQSMAETPQVT